MGSALRIKTCTLDNAALLSVGGEKIYVCDGDGRTSTHLVLMLDGIIVLGNESLGYLVKSPSVKDVFAIPGGRSLGAESLNVASAAAMWRVVGEIAGAEGQQGRGAEQGARSKG